jgi:hypothetical protein
MMGKQMEGSNRQRRQAAREAREEGHQPSEVGETLGASKQRKEAPENASQPEKLAQKREGKQADQTQGRPEPKPGNRGSRSSGS